MNNRDERKWKMENQWKIHAGICKFTGEIYPFVGLISKNRLAVEWSGGVCFKLFISYLTKF